VADLGLIYTGTRRGPDDEVLRSGPNQDDGWTMFVSQEADVGSIGQWLDAVEKRLNDDDISNDKDIFRWKVSFTVTSWGNHTPLRCLQDVIIDSEVADIVAGTYDLTKPQNQMNLRTLPLHNYFHTQEVGVQILQQHLDSILDE
jgi:hypothetical protein